MAEQRSPKPQVGGSIPFWPAKQVDWEFEMGSKKAMTKKQAGKESSSFLNNIKWLLVFAMIVFGVVANIHYSDISGAVRAAVGLVGFLLALSIYFSTYSGVKAWAFIKGAQAEMRKVTWPTRPETMQMTMIVIIVLIVTSLLLWCVDGLFLRLVGLLTGQGG